jgi:hypothetical protein
MNCLEFRRQKLADPRRLPTETKAHAAGCPACAAFAREVDESEQALDRALTVPVPEGLADRILFRSRTPRSAWRPWALAAGVLLAAGIGFSALQGAKAPDEYARLAIEHVAMEPESQTSVQEPDPAAFRTVVQNLGGSVKDMPGRIRYMKLCPYGEGLAWHVVVETPEGPATLFLVPDKRPPTVQAASFGGWSARVEPTGPGYYAVVTGSSGATSRFVKLLRESIVWSI